MSKEQSVVVSNDLVRAVQRLSLPEKRLLMLAVSELDSGLDINQVVTVRASDYSALYGIQQKNTYTTLQSAEKRLWNRELIIPEIAGDMVIRWIISYRYNKGMGSVSLKFHPDLNGHIINLKERFTRYLLSRAADFKYLYSWRLFELILQFKKTGLLKISADEFKKIMEVPKAYDSDFGLVRRKVINLAIKEIKEKDGLEIKYTVTKTGRKITGLEFTFPPEQQKTLPLSKPKKTSTTKINKAYIEQHARPGETYETARRRLEEERKKEKAA